MASVKLNGIITVLWSTQSVGQPGSMRQSPAANGCVVDNEIKAMVCVCVFVCGRGYGVFPGMTESKRERERECDVSYNVRERIGENKSGWRVIKHVIS